MNKPTKRFNKWFRTYSKGRHGGGFTASMLERICWRAYQRGRQDGRETEMARRTAQK